MTQQSQTRAVALRVQGVSKSYGAVTALDDVGFDLAKGEFLTLLGPSGSGKTTLLKAIAGFEDLDSGALTLDGRDLASLHPSRRDIGMVFQNYALFPHLTVQENVAFPLRMRKVDKREVRARVAATLEMVELGRHGERYPSQLSGGQQQRVALARAVVFGPRLLLLDEPFGALDRNLREAMQVQVRRLQRQLGLTTIFITHDQEEALAMSDRIGVMHGGRLLQLDVPEMIYARPATRFVANFVGASNMIDGHVARPASIEKTVLTLDGCALDLGPCDLPAGAPATLLLRPEVLRFDDHGTPGLNVVEGRLIGSTYRGGSMMWAVQTRHGFELEVREPFDVAAPRRRSGDDVRIGWRPVDAHVVAGA